MGAARELLGSIESYVRTMPLLESVAHTGAGWRQRHGTWNSC
jgi:hypothetical protein